MSTIPEDVDIRISDYRKYIKPGRKRAPFFRYIRINLPRLTRLFLSIVFLVIALCAFSVSTSSFAPAIFNGAALALKALSIISGLFGALGILTRLRIWSFGMIPASIGILIYAVGCIFGTAPFVWNGADITLAAAWNVVFLASVAYLVLYWAMRYGILVAAPDDQGFED
ncbi:hypothetical protein [Corynebacterium caspium]|uniref:hypothetical protein n=1 Tax=Corynebacterium caspium TaxID=234828 RepID=UPI0003625DCE|nr:hypothetical protein [Corynebacterium caspium]WKD59296.1 hypothetical protein CCASP_04500 [Corynebacterium caspium DSM 44850]